MYQIYRPIPANTIPTNTTNICNVLPTLGQRRRRWASIGQTLGRCVVFVGIHWPNVELMLVRRRRPTINPASGQCIVLLGTCMEIVKTISMIRVCIYVYMIYILALVYVRTSYDVWVIAIQCAVKRAVTPDKLLRISPGGFHVNCADLMATCGNSRHPCELFILRSGGSTGGGAVKGVQTPYYSK